MTNESNKDFGTTSGTQLATEIERHLENPLTQVEGIVEKPLKLDKVVFPPEYDHLSEAHVNTYEAPVTDHFLDGAKAADYQKLPLIQLQRLLQMEQAELGNQEFTYVNTHPEWRQQAAMVTSAEIFFKKNPEKKAIDVSLEVDDEGNIECSEGRRSGTFYRTFKDDDRDNESANALGFFRQQNQLKDLEQIAQATAHGEEIGPKKIDLLKKYLTHKKERWDNQMTAIDITNPAELSEHEQAKRRFDFINKALTAVEMYKHTDESEITKAGNELAQKTESFVAKHVPRQHKEFRPKRRNMHPPRRGSAGPKGNK